MNTNNSFYQIAVCDDDQIFLDIIKEKLESKVQQNGGECLVKVFDNSEKFVQCAGADEDLYLLDIDMPGFTGIELAKRLEAKNKTGDIIFISNHEEMVFEAIHYAPFRFIRKERLDLELPEAVDAWLARIEKKKRESLVTLQTRDGVVNVPLSHICYFESNRHYLLVHCSDDTYEVRGKISEYEENLKAHDFVRANVGYLVNCQHIKLLKAGKIVLKTGEEINISRAKRELVTHAYMESVRRYTYESNW